MDSLCRRVLPGAYYLLDRVRGSGITGHVIDSASGEPLVAEIKVLEATSTPDTIQPRTSDSVFGRFWHPLRAGICTVEVSKYGWHTKRLSGVLVRRDTLTVLEIALARDQSIQEERFTGPATLSLVLSQKAYAVRIVGISYSVPQAGGVRLAVFDQCGRQVRELVNRTVQPGTYCASWDGFTNRGLPAAPGVYFIRLASGKQQVCRKLVIS